MQKENISYYHAVGVERMVMREVRVREAKERPEGPTYENSAPHPGLVVFARSFPPDMTIFVSECKACCLLVAVFRSSLDYLSLLAGVIRRLSSNDP